MSLIGRLFSASLNPALSLTSKLNQNVQKFHSLSQNMTKGTQNLALMSPGGFFNVTIRTIIRDHFPKPSERKRVKRHGWVKRMSTPAGRRVIMNRILKGRFVYTH